MSPRRPQIDAGPEAMASSGEERAFARPTGKYTDLIVALTRLLRARLLAKIDTGDRRWSAQLSGRLDQVDEGLTRLGYFDVADAP